MLILTYLFGDTPEPRLGLIEPGRVEVVTGVNLRWCCGCLRGQRPPTVPSWACWIQAKGRQGIRLCQALEPSLLEERA